MKTKLPYKTFNLFFSFNADVPFIDKLYKWVTSVGRYIVIGIEMIVLAAFIGRFFLDQSVNDLSDKIKDNNQRLVENKQQIDRFTNLFDKLDKLQLVTTTLKADLLKEIPTVYTISQKYSSMILKSTTYYSAQYQGSPLAEDYLSISGTVKSLDLPKFKDDLVDQILKTVNTKFTPPARVLEINVIAKVDGNSDFTYRIYPNK